MSYDEYDAAYDQWISDLYEEFKPEVISEFTVERLQSYYLTNPMLAEAPRRALIDASSLFSAKFYSASFVFAQISTETAIKHVVLKPVIYGLVHSASTAEFIAELALSHTGINRFHDVLFKILLEHAKLDLGNFRRDGVKVTLWEEIKNLQGIRNRVLHRADLVGKIEAELSMKVALEVLDKIFPALMNGIHLHIHDGVRICDDPMCKFKEKYGDDFLKKLPSKEEGA